ncbi:hypothetical protein N7523_005685 [Penicillium sp. IBT 18751x]|nr:hypothetical protein N7523_005685 [Penicillium sp. IBT 18751x]
MIHDGSHLAGQETVGLETTIKEPPEPFEVKTPAPQEPRNINVDGLTQQQDHTAKLGTASCPAVGRRVRLLNEHREIPLKPEEELILLDVVAKQSRLAILSTSWPKAAAGDGMSFAELYQMGFQYVGVRNERHLLSEWAAVMGKRRRTKYTVKPDWWPCTIDFQPAKKLSEHEITDVLSSILCGRNGNRSLLARLYRAARASKLSKSDKFVITLVVFLRWTELFRMSRRYR